MYEKSMKKSMKKFSTMILAILIFTTIPASIFSVEAAGTSTASTKEPVVNETTGVRYEWYDDISAFRVKTGDYYQTCPEKAGYVFGGWFSDSADTSEAVANSVTKGGAWAKFVPEETLSVKAQINTSLKGVDLAKTDLNTVNLRLCTAVDSLKYNIVGFDISMDGGEIISYPMDTVYKTIAVRADEANLEGMFVDPVAVFGDAAFRFATLRIITIPNTSLEFTELDISVTPYWITKDGSKVEGVVRSNLLISDELANYADCEGFDENEATSTFSETSASTNASYIYYQNASDTVYLAGAYTTAESGNHFGITIRNGGQTRQVYYDNMGVKVYSGEGITDEHIIAAYDTITNRDGAFVWSQTGVVDNDAISANNSAVSAMLSAGNVGKSNTVIWAIEENVLYGSVNGYVFLRIPMTSLCDEWVDGRYYQLGVAAYNSDTITSSMSFTKENLQFGKNAYGTNEEPLLIAESEDVTLTDMAYEAITGSYMSATDANGYAYGQSAESSSAIGMETSIKWQNLDNSRSGAGITVQSGSETREIYFKYNGSSADYTISRQQDHSSADYSLNEQFYSNPFAWDTCNIKVAVYNEKLFVLVNDLTAFESALDSSDMFGDTYSADNKICIGVATWNSKNGQACFGDVTIYEGQEAIDLKTENWTFYSAKVTAGKPQIDVANGAIAVSEVVTTKVYFEGNSRTWEITGQMKQETLTNLVLQGFAVKGSREADNGVLGEDGTYTGTYYSANKETLFYGQHQGFAVVPGWNFDYNDFTKRSSAGAAKYYIYNEEAINFFRDANAENQRSETEIDFQLVLVDDTLYFWMDDILTWRIPLTNSRFGGYEAGSMYQLGVAFAEDDTTSDAQFKNLSVKTGDEVALSNIPSFVVKESNMDIVDNISGKVERNEASEVKTLYFAGTDANNADSQWEVSGTMYRNNLEENVMMGFAIRSGNIEKYYYGHKQGFAMTKAASLEYCDTVSNTEHNSYIFNQDTETFFDDNAKSCKEIEFRAVLADDILYVYFDDELSWKIPLTDSRFGGFAAGSSYELGVAFNSTDVGTAGFKNLTVSSGKEVLTKEDFYIRDPYVLTDNGTYYLYGSRFGGSFDVFTSKDMIVWEKQEPCFVHENNSWGVESDYWAPEVFKYTNPDDGETAYYMFATFRGDTRKRGTAILKADSPLGPFEEWSVDSGDEALFGPVTPSTQQCLDGTLYIEDGVPYMIYCYEYSDENAGGLGEMHYVRLSNDLKRAVDQPVKMFDARIVYNILDGGYGTGNRITDGPQIYKASDGTLFLLWSTYYPNSEGDYPYVQVQLKSSNNKLVGATWSFDKNYSILYGNGKTSENVQSIDNFDGGHGMIFNGIDGNDYLILHTPSFWYQSVRSCLSRSTIFEITYDTKNGWLKLTTYEVSGTITGQTSGSITATETSTNKTYTFTDALGTDGTYKISLPNGKYKLYFDCGDTEGLIPSVTISGNAVTCQNLAKTYPKLGIYSAGESATVDWVLTDNGRYEVQTSDESKNTVTMGYFDTVSKLSETDFVIHTNVEAAGNTNVLIGLLMQGNLEGVGKELIFGIENKTDNGARCYERVGGNWDNHTASSMSYDNTNFEMTMVKNKNTVTIFIDGTKFWSWDVTSLKDIDYSGMTDVKIGIGIYRMYDVTFSDYSYSTDAADISAALKSTVSGAITGVTGGSITATETTTGETFKFADALKEDGTYAIRLSDGTYKLYFDCGDTEGLIPSVTVSGNAVTGQNLAKTYQKIGIYSWGQNATVNWVLTDNGRYEVRTSDVSTNTVSMGYFDTVSKLSETDFVIHTNVEAAGNTSVMIGLVVNGKIDGAENTVITGLINNTNAATNYRITDGIWCGYTSSSVIYNKTNFKLTIVKKGNIVTFFTDGMKYASWDISNIVEGANTLAYSDMTDARIGLGIYRMYDVTFSDYSYSTNAEDIDNALNTWNFASGDEGRCTGISVVLKKRFKGELRIEM